MPSGIVIAAWRRNPLAKHANGMRALCAGNQQPALRFEEAWPLQEFPNCRIRGKSCMRCVAVAEASQQRIRNGAIYGCQ